MTPFDRFNTLPGVVLQAFDQMICILPWTRPRKGTRFLSFGDLFAKFRAEGSQGVWSEKGGQGAKESEVLVSVKEDL